MTATRRQRWPPTTPAPATPTSGVGRTSRSRASPSRKPAPTSKRCWRNATSTAASTARSLAISATPRPRVAALALAVGVVLADSSIVVLALPDIYRELNTSVSGVTWVLVSFNLVMALAAVPAALVARRVGPGRAAAVGLAIFAGAGLACGLADDLSTLVVARCVQALGGAAAVTAALELLPATVGSERRGATPRGGARGARGAPGAGAGGPPPPGLSRRAGFPPPGPGGAGGGGGGPP